MYGERHGVRPSLETRNRRLVWLGPIWALLVILLVPTAALGSGRPKGCTGIPPTAITFEQTLLTPNPGDSVNFTYEVSSGTAFDAGSVVATTSLTVGSGQTMSALVSGLSKGGYTVHQEPDPASGIAPGPDQTVTVSPPACVPVVSYTSIVDLA
jgi:plastocyanin